MLLLSLPVVAVGQVPGVDQVVGGVNQAARGVIQAAPAPPVRLPAAPAPAPRSAPVPAAPAPAPAAPVPSASAPPAAPAGSAPAFGSQASDGSASGGTSARTSGKRANGGSHVQALAASDKKASASQDSGAMPTDTQIADEAASVPRDASPDTLPFTGLQLALVLMAGMTALAVGAVTRRAVRS
jgi:hypothetical protein